MATAAASLREMVDQGMMRIPEAARFSGIGRSKLYELIRSGQVASAVVGGRRVVPKRGLVDFLAAQVVVSN